MSLYNPGPALDGNGDPVVGAKLYFFSTGTSTLKSIYKDSSFTNPHSNPVLSVEGGVFPAIYLDGVYRVVLHDDEGNNLWPAPVDPAGEVGDSPFTPWSSDATYNIPDIIKGSDDEYYRSLTDNNQGNDPTTTPANWEQLEFGRVWDAVVTYSKGDVVIGSDNLHYTSTINSNLNNNPTTDTNNWASTLDPFRVSDLTDPTIQVLIDAAGTTGTKTTLVSSQTVDRTLTLPDATDTIVGRNTTDDLANKTIGDTNTINAQDDAFAIQDAADSTKQIDFDAGGTTSTKTTIASTQTTNKTVTLPDVELTMEAGFLTARTDSTLVGSGALFSLNTVATRNCTAIGNDALGSNTTGTNNTAVGASALRANTIGVNNTAVGYQALDANTTSIDNTAIGYKALISNTNGNSNTAVGSISLFSNTTGTNNTAVGVSALRFNTIGINNTAVGDGALENNTTGTSNTAVGYQALRFNNTGINNTAVGYQALDVNTTGTSNTAVGHQTLGSNTTGTNNTAVGDDALLNNTTGITNTAVGSTAASTLTTGTNVSCFGYNAEPSTATVSNEVTLGDANVTALRCAVTTITAISDRRDKKDVAVIPVGLDFINELNPVIFTWNMRGGGKKDILDINFIAQDLLASSKKYDIEWLDLVYQENPDRLEAAPGKLIPIMVKAIQELSAKVEELELRV